MQNISVLRRTVMFCITTKLVPEKWTLIYILYSPFLGHKFCPYAEHIRSAQNEDRSARKEDGAAQNNLHSAQNVPCSSQKDQNMRFCTLVICKSGSLSFPGREMARHQRSNDLE